MRAETRTLGAGEKKTVKAPKHLHRFWKSNV